MKAPVLLIPHPSQTETIDAHMRAGNNVTKAYLLAFCVEVCLSVFLGCSF